MLTNIRSTVQNLVGTKYVFVLISFTRHTAYLLITYETFSRYEIYVHVTFYLDDLAFRNLVKYLWRNEFNLLVYKRGSIKNTVCRSAKKRFFFSILRVNILDRKHVFLTKQRRKTSNCFRAVCLFSL